MMSTGSSNSSGGNGASVSLKRKVIEATKIIKKKFTDYKRDLNKAERDYYKEHRQIIEPLQEIAVNVNQQRRQQPKVASSPQQQQQLIKTNVNKSDTEDDELDDSEKDDEKAGDENGGEVEDVDDEAEKRDDEEEEVEVEYEEVEGEEADPANITSHYANLLRSKNAKVDRSRYALRYIKNTDSFRIGDSEVAFVGANLIVKGHEYQVTPGLFNLLTIKNPQRYTENDVGRYRLLILQTYAHRYRYSAAGDLYPNRSLKYTKFLQSFIADLSTPSKQGGELLKKVDSTKHGVEYVYWNRPSELVKRLRLLYASKWAGNTSHDNEIISILEELREEGLIQ